MGLSTSKSKTTTNQTSTPVVSQPYSQDFQNYSGKVNDFLNTDPTQYVAPASQLQNQAFSQAQNLGAWKPLLNSAAQSAAAGATPVDATQLGPAAMVKAAQVAPTSLIYQGMSKYQDPYTQQVIDSSLANFDEYAGQQRAAEQANAAKTAAFGGSRYGIEQAALEGNLARDRNSVVSNLLNQGWMNSANLAGQDANAVNARSALQAQLAQQAGLANQGARNSFSSQQAAMEQQAALANQQAALQAAAIQGQLGQTASGSELADLSAVAGLGQTQRDIASAYTNAVPTQLQLAGSLYSQLNPAIYAGQNVSGTSTTTGSPGLGNILAGVAGAGLQGLATGGIKF